MPGDAVGRRAAGRRRFRPPGRREKEHFCAHGFRGSEFPPRFLTANPPSHLHFQSPYEPASYATRPRPLLNPPHHPQPKPTAEPESASASASGGGGGGGSSGSGGGAAGASASFSAGGYIPPVKADINALPIRAYLDQTVVPLLLQAMSQLVKEVRLLLDAPRARAYCCYCRPPYPPCLSPALSQRPDRPIQWLAAYLLKNDPTELKEGEVVRALCARACL